MAMIACPECKTEVSSSAQICPRCGFSLAAYRKRKDDAARQVGCLGLIVGLLVVGGVMTTISDCQRERAQAEAAQQKRESDAREAAALKVRQTKLVETLPQRLEQLSAQASLLDAALDADDVEEARSRMSKLVSALAPYKELTTQPEGVTALMRRQAAAARRLMVLEADDDLKAERFEQALARYLAIPSLDDEGDAEDAVDPLTPKIAKARWGVIAQQEAAAKQLSKDKRWIEAEQRWRQVLASVEAQPEGDAARKAKLASVTRELNRVKRPAQRLRDQETKALVYATLCGDSPTPSPWDGGIYTVERAVARGAHDPGSIEVTSCTQPVLTAKQCWKVQCDVRGKNAFGAKVVNVGTFWISAQGVIKSKL